MENHPKPPFNRRKFLVNFAKVAGVGAAGYIYLSDRENKVTEMPTPPMNKHILLTKPYLFSLSSEKLIIRWISNKLSYSWVEFGKTAELNQKAESVTDGLVNFYRRIHEIELSGLIAGQEYYYRVASKEILRFENEESITYGETIYSDLYSFTTLPSDKSAISWLQFNDIHDRPNSFADLFNLNKHESYDFVFLNGDMFNFQKDEEQIIEHLIKPCSEIFATKKPMLFARGNHEMRGQFAGDLANYFSWSDRRYFTFQAGPVLIIVLDTCEENMDHNFDRSDAFREQQAKWLEDVMQTKAYQNAKYRVVLMHIPPYHSFDAKGSKHCKQVYSPLFDKYAIDLVIAGHTHAYGVHHPERGKHNYPIVIGGGPIKGNRTLIQVKANHAQLQLTMWKDDGSVVGEYKLQAR